MEEDLEVEEELEMEELSNESRTPRRRCRRVAGQALLYFPDDRAAHPKLIRLS